MPFPDSGRSGLHILPNKRKRYNEIIKKITFESEKEIRKWKSIIELIYLPKDESLGIFLQQEGYMDKEQILANELDPAQRPINQHGSWDRILRSCLIKQADVLQGLYLCEDYFSTETIRPQFRVLRITYRT